LDESGTVKGKDAAADPVEGADLALWVSDLPGIYKNVKRFLVLDLETVADEELVSAVAGDPTQPYTEQVKRLLDERRARSGGRSDFLPLPYHRPVAACGLDVVEEDGWLSVTDLFSWTDHQPQTEAHFLTELWDRLAGTTLVTFRGRGFDVPVLELRSLKLQISSPSWFSDANRGAGHHLDLADLLSNQGATPGAPLDLYAKLVGLPGKEAVAGKDVLSLYSEGALHRIAAYCMTDVLQTYFLLLRFRQLEGSLSQDGYTRSVTSARRSLSKLFASRLAAEERSFLDGFLQRCAAFFQPSGGRAGGRRLLSANSA
jgi:hypothetical protein